MNKMTRAEKQEVRLNRFVTEWCSLENEKRDFYRKKMLENDLETSTIQTLYMMQDRIDWLVFQIVKKVDWFIHNNEDFDNEVAHMIYDKYASGLHRGLTSLLHHFEDRQEVGLLTLEARKNPNGMNAVQVIEVIKDLAKSQGFYSRMWQNIQENILTDEEKYENFQQFCEEQNFKDAVDLVLYFECQRLIEYCLNTPLKVCSVEYLFTLTLFLRTYIFLYVLFCQFQQLFTSYMPLEAPNLPF